MTLEPQEQALAGDAPSPGKADAVLVLGMHRGGTSALAGLLQLSGFELGRALMEPAAGVNDKGFFENLDAFQIHERLLASLGRSRFDPREMPLGWREHPAYRIAADEIADLVRRDFGASARWTVKDPRMCRIVPVWIDALASLGILPHAILVVRHPAEVARSMRAQRWVASSARAHLCWLQHMLEAEQATRAIPRALVTYDALLAGWPAERERLGRELGIEWPALDAEGAAAIDAFLDTRERHFDEAVDGDGMHGVPALAMEVFEFCRRGGANAWAEIATLGETFARGAEAFGPCLDEAIVEASLAFIEVAGLRGNTALVDGDAGPSATGVDARLQSIGRLIADVAARVDSMDGCLRDICEKIADGKTHPASRDRPAKARARSRSRKAGKRD